MTRQSPPVAQFWPGAPLRDGTLTLGRVPQLLFVAALVLVLPWLAAIVIPFTEPLAQRIDPHDFWFKPTVHQLSSLALTLILMRTLSTRSWSDWGFNLRNAGAGMLLAALFAVLVTPLMYLLVNEQPAPATGISRTEIAANLLSHFFIMGFTQEVLFRAFAMGMLAQRWPTSAGLWAAIIFMLAHVQFVPPYVWPEQLALSLLFGLLYAIMYARTGSLLAPSVAHGCSNGIFVILLLYRHAA
jgi:membrane protease YdiL (CAAX protease family)